MWRQNRYWTVKSDLLVRLKVHFGSLKCTKVHWVQIEQSKIIPFWRKDLDQSFLIFIFYTSKIILLSIFNTTNIVIISTVWSTVQFLGKYKYYFKQYEFQTIDSNEDESIGLLFIVSVILSMLKSHKCRFRKPKILRQL